MMKFKRILSLLLAVLTICGCFSFGISVSAANTDTPEEEEDYVTATNLALERTYTKPRDLLDKEMQLTTRLYGYELYCNQYTGEIAFVNQMTGQILTSNPYDLTNIGATTKAKLLSQLEVKFTDSSNTTTYMYSFSEAAQRGQIKLKTIKDGIRLEYTMGRIDTSYLLPIYIEKSRFEDLILEPMYEHLETLDDTSDAYEQLSFYIGKLTASYTLYDPNDLTQNAATIASMKAKYEVTRNGMAIYVLSSSTDKEKRILEGYIKSYCPDYNEEELQYDMEQTKAPSDTAETPVFRMSIEYKLEEDGLAVRLPANGIRFDETKYTLSYIRMLQFFGAGNLKDGDGYVFYPDGSGSLIQFSDYYSTDVGGRRVSVELSGNVYGNDYAYYNISNAKHQELIRMPVFGVIDPVVTTKTIPLPNGGYDTVSTTETKGFLAILEEGASLAQISASFGATTHNYGSVFTTFFPRPTDTYNMQDAISVGDNKDWTVVSDKKYTGSYVLKIVMLTDSGIGDQLIEEGKIGNYYEASYVGMAKAYRDYLLKNGTLKPLSNVKDQLPLYIQSFGSFKTIERILSIPIEMDAPLTTFDDVQLMYADLAENGITNVNFQLTGFANGGMESTYPTKLKWNKKVGGGDGFQALLDDANEKGYGVYPDFDFMYISTKKAFDGIWLKRDASRAVDDRYSSKQFYDALYQEFVSYFDLVVTPSAIKGFTNNFPNVYNNENLIGISVSTMGSDLNSDFNEDNLYNRDDAQQVLDESLAYLKEYYGSVMENGGNAYTLKYVDHLLEAAIDSSRFKYNSHTVPFVGMVLHGCVNYAGSAINEAGDGDYQMLKAVESGAALFYTLSYEDDNIIKMKDDEKLSENYSIRYSIWHDTLIRQYKKLNDAIGDLQTYQITDHEFLIGERVPQETERNKDLVRINEAIVSAMEEAYNTALENRYRALNISQVTITLMKKGITDGDELIREVRDRLYSVVLTEEDRNMILSLLEAGDVSEPYFGKNVTAQFDRAGIVASLEAKLGKALTEEQGAVVDAFIASHTDTTGDYVETIAEVNLAYVNPVTDSYATDGKNYVATKYTDNGGGIVMVTYSNGTDTVRFILNYNTFDVVVRLEGMEPITVGSFDFVRI